MVTKARPADQDMPAVALHDHDTKGRPRLVVAVEMVDPDRMGLALWDGSATKWDAASWYDATTDFTWLDLACDCRGLTVDLGRKSIFTNMEAGVAAFTLANRDGRYSQFADNMTMTRFLPGRGCVIWSIQDDVVHPMFSGIVTRWEEHYTDNDPRVEVQASDRSFLATEPRTGDPWDPGDFGDSLPDRLTKILSRTPLDVPTRFDPGHVALLSRQTEDSYAEEIAKTCHSDGGVSFLDADGCFLYLDRNSRVLGRADAPTKHVFACGDGLPYWFGDPVTDDDSIFNAVTLTNDDQETGHAEDQASIDLYRRREYNEAGLLFSTPQEGQDLASYVVTNRKDVYFRIEDLALYPDAESTLWSVALSMRVGDMIRLLRDLPNGLRVDADLLLEGVSVSAPADGLWLWSFATSTARALNPFSRWDSGSWDDAQWTY